MKTKICPRCKKKRPLSEFYKHKGSKSDNCILCREYNSWYHKNPAHQEKQRERRLKRKFNITLEQYDKMFEAQNGVCLICKQPETRMLWGIVTRLSIDHDHKTNKVRALLCDRCNKVLGWVDDDINLFQIMIKYLKESNQEG